MGKRPCVAADLHAEIGKLAMSWKHLVASDESTSLLGRISEQLARITDKPVRLESLDTAVLGRGLFWLRP